MRLSCASPSSAAARLASASIARRAPIRKPISSLRRLLGPLSDIGGRFVGGLLKHSRGHGIHNSVNQRISPRQTALLGADRRDLGSGQPGSSESEYKEESVIPVVTLRTGAESRRPIPICIWLPEEADRGTRRREMSRANPGPLRGRHTRPPAWKSCQPRFREGSLLTNCSEARWATGSSRLYGCDEGRSSDSKPT